MPYERLDEPTINVVKVRARGRPRKISIFRRMEGAKGISQFGTGVNPTSNCCPKIGNKCFSQAIGKPFAHDNPNRTELVQGHGDLSMRSKKGLNMVNEIDDDDIDNLIARESFASICEIDVLKVAKEYLVPIAEKDIGGKLSLMKTKTKGPVHENTPEEQESIDAVLQENGVGA